MFPSITWVVTNYLILFSNLGFTTLFTGINVLSQLEAAAVNLVAKEKPADVYTEIAVRYIKLILATFPFFSDSTIYCPPSISRYFSTPSPYKNVYIFLFFSLRSCIFLKSYFMTNCALE